MKCGALPRRQLRHDGARCAERRAGVRKDDRAAAQPARDGDAVEAGGTAAADQHGILRIDALLHGGFLDRVHHGFGAEIDDGERGVLDREAERARHLRRDGRARRIDRKLHPAAEEEFGIDVSEGATGGIGDGRSRPPPRP